LRRRRSVRHLSEGTRGPALPDAQKKLLEDFQKKVGPNVAVSACASCGVLVVDGSGKELALADLRVELTDEEAMEHRRRDKRLAPFYSVYEHAGKLYHLHRRLVVRTDERGVVWVPLCVDCSKASTA
jgi:hypothetical protein